MICLGIRTEELFQKTFQDLTLPEDRPESTKVLRKLLSGEIKVSSVPKRYIRKNGSIISNHASASVVRDDAGEPKYLVTAIVDLTEQKYSSEIIQKQYEQLQATFDLSSVGIVNVTFRR